MPPLTKLLINRAWSPIIIIPANIPANHTITIYRSMQHLSHSVLHPPPRRLRISVEEASVFLSWHGHGVGGYKGVLLENGVEGGLGGHELRDSVQVVHVVAVFLLLGVGVVVGSVEADGVVEDWPFEVRGGRGFD